MPATTSSAGVRAQSMPPKPSNSPQLSPTAPSFNPSEKMRTGSSSVTSEKTAVPTRQITPGAIKATPGSGAAIFSTQDGRYPHRPPPGPPFTPVIVRSNFVPGVVEFANYWRNKYPQYYHCFFSGAGWTITDLWDKADIHLESPVFLQEVLKFIIKDNEFRAHRFATEWSTMHPEKLDMIGGDLAGIFDPHDSMGFVYKIFTDGETNFWPPEFLYQVLWVMRTAMHITMEQQQRASEATAKEDAARQLSDDRPYRNHAPPPMSRTSTGVSQPSYAQGARGPPLGGHISMAPQLTNGQLRNSRNRRNYSSSNSGAYSTPFQGQDDSRVPSDHRFRQPSGRPIHGAPRLPSQIPMETAPMGGMVHLSRFHQPSPFTSPSFQPAQLAFGPMLHHGAMPPPPAPYDLRRAGPVYQALGPGPQDPRGGVPFEEMTNSMQYHVDRNMEHRGSMSHRGSTATKPIGLFNPYGAERPEKAANFTQIPMGKKGGRGGFQNSIGRGRKFSNAGFRGSFSTAYDRDDAPPRVPSGMFTGNFGERYMYNQRDPSIVNDMEFGCDAHRIGPSNTTVKKLYISNLPDNVTEQQLLKKFQAKANAYRVDLKIPIGHTEVTHAFVHFSSPAEARKCLPDVCRFELHNKQLAVSVPFAYYRLPEPFPSSREASRRYSSLSSAADESSRQNNSGQPQYSPQDARSDLNRNNRQQHHHHQELPRNRGSPRAREPKIKGSPKKKAKHPPREQLVREEANDVAGPVNEIVGKSTKDGSAEDEVPKECAIVPAAQETGKGQEAGKGQESEKDETDNNSAPNTPTVHTVAEVSTEGQVQEEATVGDLTGETASLDQVDCVVQPDSPPLLADSCIVEGSSVEPQSELMKQEATISEEEKRIVVDEAVVTVQSPRSSNATIFEDDQKSDLNFQSVKEGPEEPLSLSKHETLVSSPTASELAQAKTLEVASSNPESEPEHSEVSPPAAVEEPAKPSIVEPVKKQGAKQTQSLCPFAQSKTQAKKEKQAKKKGKKKGRKEMNKLEKAAPDMKDSENISTPTVNRSPGEIKTTKEKIEHKAEDLGEIEPADTAVSEAAREADTMNEGSDESIDPKIEAEAQTQDHQRVFSGIGSRASGSAFPVESAAMLQGEMAPNLELPTTKPQVTKEAPKKKAAHLPQIAVPRLNLAKPKLSASGHTLPLFKTGSPPKVKPFETNTSTQPTSQTVEHTDAGEDTKIFSDARETMSVASSPTLRADSPLPVPASTTTEFFTPMPTPTEQHRPLETPVESAPPAVSTLKKKKKSKSKKKKVKPTPDTHEDQTTQPGSEADPFHRQMNEIADIIAKKNDETSSHGGNSGQEATGGQGETLEVKVGDAATTTTTRTARDGDCGKLSDHADSSPAGSSAPSTSS